MLFVGIDLAWSKKNGSGIAIIEGDKDKAKLCSADVLYSDEEIIDRIQKEVKDKHAFIAIDAPLIVPNEEGRRTAEKLVGALFRKYDAGAHPSNRQRLSQWCDGKIRGEELSDLLEKSGFEHSPEIKRFEKTKKFFEVYPHPSMVVLFNLDRILRYKAKPKRDYNFRWNEFEKYQGYLRALKNATPSLVLPEEVIGRNVRELRAQSLKNYEDLLDAIFCAYVAYYSLANPDKCRVLGSIKEGYIMTPVFEFMQKQLKEAGSQAKLGKF